MKKLFLLLAMAGTMVACGGNDKKDDKQATSVEEQGASAKEQVLSVEEQVTVYFNKMKAISFSDSDGQQELEELINEMTAWSYSLSDADKEIAGKVMEELLKADAEKRVKIKEQAEAYAVEMNTASEAGDIEKMAQIAGEMQEWYNTLSPDEQMFAEAIVARQGASVEEQAKAYVNELKAAVEAGDHEKAQKIATEMYDWYEGLSDAEKEAVDKATENM